MRVLFLFEFVDFFQHALLKAVHGLAALCVPALVGAKYEISSNSDPHARRFLLAIDNDRRVSTVLRPAPKPTITRFAVLPDVNSSRTRCAFTGESPISNPADFSAARKLSRSMSAA